LKDGERSGIAVVLEWVGRGGMVVEWWYGGGVAVN
jgi:hypothetical protein